MESREIVSGFFFKARVIVNKTWICYERMEDIITIETSSFHDALIKL